MIILTVMAAVRISHVAAFSFGAVGDHGADSKTVATLKGAKNTKLDFFLSLGDLSYGKIKPKSGETVEEAWCNFVHKHYTASPPMQLLVGNHEDYWSAQYRSGAYQGYILDYVDACLPNPSDRLIDGGEYGVQYYFDYPKTGKRLARFVMLAAGLNAEGQRYDYWGETNDGRDWLIETIQDARADGIPWVIVAMHEPCLSIGSKTCRHTPAVQAGVDCKKNKNHPICKEEKGDLSPLYDLLLDKTKGVMPDLILAGDDHHYLRSHQLALDEDCPGVRKVSSKKRGNCVAKDPSDGKFTQGDGAVVVVAGTGGVGLRSIKKKSDGTPSDTDAPLFAKSNDKTWGFVKVEVTDTKLDVRYVQTAKKSGASNFSDHFTITKPTPSPSPIITFDDLPEGTPVSDQYFADYGVTFALFDGDPNGQPTVEDALRNPDRFVGMTPKNILVGSGYAPGSGGSWNCHENVKMTFDPAAKSASIDVFAKWDDDFHASAVRMVAKNTNGSVVATDTFAVPPEDQAWGEETVRMEVRTDTARISTVELHMERICWALDNLAIDQPSQSKGFMAYNDLAWASGQGSGNFTKITSPNGKSGLPSKGELVDFATGDGTGVKLEVRGGSFNGGTHATKYSGAPKTNSPAYTVFNGKVDAMGSITYRNNPSPKGDLTLIFTGLKPSKRYRLVFFGHRAKYDWDRASLVTLKGASQFKNTSSEGTDNHGDPTYTGVDDDTFRMPSDNHQGWIGRVGQKGVVTKSVTNQEIERNAGVE